MIYNWAYGNIVFLLNVIQSTFLKSGTRFVSLTETCSCTHTYLHSLFYLQYHCTVNLFLWLCCNRIPKFCWI